MLDRDDADALAISHDSLQLSSDRLAKQSQSPRKETDNGMASGKQTPGRMDAEKKS